MPAWWSCNRNIHQKACKLFIVLMVRNWFLQQLLSATICTNQRYLRSIFGTLTRIRAERDETYRLGASRSIFSVEKKRIHYYYLVIRGKYLADNSSDGSKLYLIPIYFIIFSIFDYNNHYELQNSFLYLLGCSSSFS